MSRLPGIAAAILAGGLATRMGGRPKALLSVDGKRILDRQLEVLSALFEEILLCANDPAPYGDLGLPIVADEVRGQGPLAGILAALGGARAERVVVVACDMPYLTVDALALVAAPSAPEDVVVPVVGGRPEPLCARYSRACTPPIRALLARGERKVARLFEHVSVRTLDEATLRSLDPELRFLENWNRPEDVR